MKSFMNHVTGTQAKVSALKQQGRLILRLEKKGDSHDRFAVLSQSPFFWPIDIAVAFFDLDYPQTIHHQHV